MPLCPRPPWEPRFAWVTNERAGTVTVFDTATDKVVATLNARGARPRGLQLTADGKRLYVAPERHRPDHAKSAADAIVAARRRRPSRALARFDVGSDPERFVVSRDGSRLYSANEDAGTATVTEHPRRTR